MAKVVSSAIQNDLDKIEKIKAKQAYKVRKGQELEISLLVKITEDEDKARVRAVQSQLKEQERLKEIASKEALAKEKAGKRLAEQEAFALEQERLAEIRKQEKEEREVARAIATEKKRLEDVKERQRLAEIAKGRVAKAKESQEVMRAKKVEYAANKEEHVAIKLEEFKAKLEIRQRENKRKGELKDKEVQEARARVASEVERVRTETEKKAGIDEARYQEQQRQAEEDQAARLEARKQHDIVLKQKMVVAEKHEEERINGIIERQALVQPRVEAAARRLEEEADKKKAEAELKHKKVDHQLELAKQRNLVQRATVRAESQKKVEKSEEFLDQKRELLIMRSAFKHDMAKSKQGWSLLSTAKTTKESNQREFDKLKQQMLEDPKSKSEDGDNGFRQINKTGRTDPGPGDLKKRLKGTSLINYTLPPFAVPPPVQRFPSLLSAGVPYAHKYEVYDVYVPGEPACFTTPVSPRQAGDPLRDSRIGPVDSEKKRDKKGKKKEERHRGQEAEDGGAAEDDGEAEFSGDTGDQVEKETEQNMS